MVAVAARMTGETNIDPLEQFGIFVTLLIASLFSFFNRALPVHILLLIAMAVSIACAVAGDAGHDYKSAAILNTRFADIVKIDLITVIIVGLAAPFVFQLFRNGFAREMFTPAMPAPQAQIVADSITGFKHPLIFITGFFIAFTFELINKFLKIILKDRIMWMPFGLGLFLGPGLAIPIALGATVNLWINKKHPSHFHSGILIAAAIMGAEGIAGFSAGALTVFGISFGSSTLILGGFFVLLLFVGIWHLRKYQLNQ
jgi:uncharacterized oligopeptide transporter (OPT) family protein